MDYEVLLLASLVSADNNLCAEDVKRNLQLLEQLKPKIMDQKAAEKVHAVLLKDLKHFEEGGSR